MNSITHKEIFENIYRKGKERFREYLNSLSSQNSENSQMGLSYLLPYLNKTLPSSSKSRYFNTSNLDRRYRVEVRRYTKDIKVVYKKIEDNIKYKSKSRSSRRGYINSFSSRSRKRLKFLLRNTANIWKVFICLTYPQEFPIDISESKKHLNAFLQFLRNKKAKYIWKMEFQNRGAVHYHIFVDKYISKYDISLRWFNIVGSGDVKHLQAGTRVEYIKCRGLVFSYIQKYATKQVDIPKEVSNVGRFWGCSRGLLVYEVLGSLQGTYIYISRKLRMLRRLVYSQFRNIGIRWRWRGFGFTFPCLFSISRCLELIS